ncbi:MAG TPA: tRNA guanosine(34) transglycosylase Tgt [Chloroflexia bacterium]|nr:tRNA guanosine(34) transglycosylase Tgt [Chloroflexia bacterium]
MNTVDACLALPSGELQLPAFLPDATLGVVRSLDSTDLERVGVQGLVMNTFHLMQKPGSSTIQALGGLHAMAGWTRPIVTDSGGFQAYSLVRENPKNGQITDKGIVIRSENKRKFQLTPAKTVQLQMGYGSDIVVCLDDCTSPEAPHAVQLESVERTVKWAREGKREFDSLLDRRGTSPDERPLLLAVIQGGTSQELRRRCALELLEIGFDGYGYGGWPLDAEGHLLLDVIAFTRELIPSSLPFHALGVGHPENIVQCTKAGCNLFDSALPTRDARHGRLYRFADELVDPTSPRFMGRWFDTLYIADDKFIKDDRPLAPYCDCLCCARYSRGYLHHLFKLGDTLFFRLATLHNLRFMTMLTAALRSAGGG